MQSGGRHKVDHDHGAANRDHFLWYTSIVFFNISSQISCHYRNRCLYRRSILIDSGIIH
jgi:hypothetical protein